MINLASAPFPVTYRELWLPNNINGTSLPSSVRGGQVLTLTGASKQSSTDGVRFPGTATSNIVVAANAAQNAKAAFHITIRFKLDITFAAGAPGDFFLFQKLLAADDYLRVYLKAADGKLYWEQGNAAGGIQFTLTSTTVSWTGGTQYIVTVSLTDTPTQRLLVNGVAEDTDTQAARATPNGGDMIIGSSSDGGTNGVVGTISWVVIGVGTTAATALTTDDEVNLSSGISPPTAKVQHMYLLDEGRGVTVTDRGSVGVNGTLDTACTWAWGQVESPVVSLDGINDRGMSPAGANISGAWTMIWAGKLKETFRNIDRVFFEITIDPNYLARIINRAWVGKQFLCIVAGAEYSVINPQTQLIDDYAIFIGTYNSAAGTMKYYVNGTMAGSAVVPSFPATSAYAYIGMNFAVSGFNSSKPLFVSQIEKAFTAKQVLAYSRWLRDSFNLPINM